MNAPHRPVHPFDELRAPSVETWQRGNGMWNWVVVDTPDPMKPGIIIWDSSEHPTARAAMEAFDQVHAEHIRRSGF